jgi:hypothetical protein
MYINIPITKVITARKPMIAENLVIRCIIIVLKVVFYNLTGSLRIRRNENFVAVLPDMIKMWGWK